MTYDRHCQYSFIHSRTHHITDTAWHTHSAVTHYYPIPIASHTQSPQCKNADSSLLLFCYYNYLCNCHKYSRALNELYVGSVAISWNKKNLD